MVDVQDYLPKEKFFGINYAHYICDVLIYRYTSWEKVAQHLASEILEGDEPEKKLEHLFDQQQKGYLHDFNQEDEWYFPNRKMPLDLKAKVEKWVSIIEEDDSYFLKIDPIDPIEILQYFPIEKDKYPFFVGSEVSGYYFAKLEDGMDGVISHCLAVCGGRSGSSDGKLDGNVIVGRCGSITFRNTPTAQKVFSSLLKESEFTITPAKTLCLIEPTGYQ